jgi:hypothetical protein
MREELKKINRIRDRFNAIVSRFGERTSYGYTKQTMLVIDVRRVRDNKRMTDHVWMIVGKTLERLQLTPGDIIEFDARVTPYKKGYRGRREDIDAPPPSIDYRLSFPTKVRKMPAKPPNLDQILDRTVEPMPKVQDQLFQ